jgi:hypothetical protein
MALLEIDQIVKGLSKDLDLSYPDASYLRQRTRSEGVSFLTKTLPKYAKFVLAGIQAGKLGPAHELSHFSWKGGLPKFLKGFLSDIFDRDGSLKENACPVALYAIRQACEYFYKLALPFGQDDLEAAALNFIATDSEVISAYDVPQETRTRLRRNLETYYSLPSRVEDVLSDSRPRFGPGTYSGHAKLGVPFYLHKKWVGTATTIPVKYQGISGFFKQYPSSPDRIKYGDDSALTSEVLFVPKDSRGPRTIIREPLHSLRLQMAYFDFLSAHLEKVTCGRINFQDQQVNQRLAQQGSIDCRWATLDLKEASDRVSYSLCEELLRNTSLAYFLKHRTPVAKLPDGTLCRMRKLAGMGSGLTFATMALLIHVTIATEISRRLAIGFKDASRMVYVYGDDIIVPTTCAHWAKRALSEVGLLVNDQKSYTHQSRSAFRESCGGDYFNGSEVAPVRLKLSAGVEAKGAFLQVNKPGALLQLERHARELVKSGMHCTSEVIYTFLERALGPLPLGSGETPVLCRWVIGDLSHLYPKNKTGRFKTVRNCYVPIPVAKDHPNYDPWARISRKFSDRTPLWERNLFGRLEVCTEVQIPRKIKLVRRRISAFQLVY